MAVEKKYTDVPRSIFGWISLASSVKKQFVAGQINQATYDDEIKRIKESANKSLERTGDQSRMSNISDWIVTLAIEFFAMNLITVILYFVLNYIH